MRKIAIVVSLTAVWLALTFVLRRPRRNAIAVSPTTASSSLPPPPTTAVHENTSKSHPAEHGDAQLIASSRYGTVGSIAVCAGYVYFTLGYRSQFPGLHRAAVDGVGSEQLLTADEHPFEVHVEGNEVFVSLGGRDEESDGRLARLVNGAPVTVIDKQFRPVMWRRYGDRWFWLAGNHPGQVVLRTRDVAGGSIRDLTELGPILEYVVLNDTVYALTDRDFVLVAQPVAGGEPRTLFDGPVLHDLVAGSDGALYVLAALDGASPGEPARRIIRVTTDGVVSDFVKFDQPLRRLARHGDRWLVATQEEVGYLNGGTLAALTKAKYADMLTVADNTAIWKQSAMGAENGVYGVVGDEVRVLRLDR